MIGDPLCLLPEQPPCRECEDRSQSGSIGRTNAKLMIYKDLHSIPAGEPSAFLFLRRLRGVASSAHVMRVMRDAYTYSR